MDKKCYFKNLKVSLYVLRTISALPALFGAVHLPAAAAGVQEHAQVLLLLICSHYLCKDDGQQLCGVCIVLCKESNRMAHWYEGENEGEGMLNMSEVGLSHASKKLFSCL